MSYHYVAAHAPTKRQPASGESVDDKDTQGEEQVEKRWWMWLLRNAKDTVQYSVEECGFIHVHKVFFMQEAHLHEKNMKLNVVLNTFNMF